MRRVAVLVVGLTVCGVVLGAGVPDARRRAGAPVPVTAGGDVPAILVSRQLLEARGLAVGDHVSLSTDPTGAGARRFRIAGLYEPVPDPMRITSRRFEARLHLPDLLELTDDRSDPLFRESVTAINVALDDPGDARSFVGQLALRVPNLSIRRTTERTAGSPFVVLEQFHLAIAIVTVVASTAFLLALMVMRSDERRETAAILRLIGLTRYRVLLQVFVEGLLIALAGAVAGIVLAVAAQGAFNRFFQWRYDTTLVFVRISGHVARQCLLFAVPLGVLASIAASWTLLRREILALLRR